MTEIATIDWFGRWGTSVFSENTAIFFYYFYYNAKSVSFQVAEILPKGNENNKTVQ